MDSSAIGQGKSDLNMVYRSVDTTMERFVGQASNPEYFVFSFSTRVQEMVLIIA